MSHPPLDRVTPTPDLASCPPTACVPLQVLIPWASNARFLNERSRSRTSRNGVPRSSTSLSAPSRQSGNQATAKTCGARFGSGQKSETFVATLWHWVCTMEISSAKMEDSSSYIFAFKLDVATSGGPSHSSIHPHGDGSLGLRSGRSTATGRAGSLARPLPLAPSITPRLGREPTFPTAGQAALEAVWPVSRCVRSQPLGKLPRG